MGWGGLSRLPLAHLAILDHLVGIKKVLRVDALRNCALRLQLGARQRREPRSGAVRPSQYAAYCTLAVALRLHPGINVAHVRLGKSRCGSHLGDGPSELGVSSPPVMRSRPSSAWWGVNTALGVAACKVFIGDSFLLDWPCRRSWV